MKFNDLFLQFISGTAIKRKPWGGYWRYQKGEIIMYCKDGAEINIKDTKDILFTVSNILQEDWEIATNSNCDIIVDFNDEKLKEKQ